MTAQSVQTALPSAYYPSVYGLYIVLKKSPLPGGQKKIMIASAGSCEDMRRTLEIFNAKWGSVFHAWLAVPPGATEFVGKWEQRWRLQLACGPLPVLRRLREGEAS